MNHPLICADLTEGKTTTLAGRRIFAASLLATNSTFFATTLSSYTALSKSSTKGATAGIWCMSHCVGVAIASMDVIEVDRMHIQLTV